MHCRETRAAGTAINTFVNLLMTFAVGQTFLSMLCAMKFGVSLFGGESGEGPECELLRCMLGNSWCRVLSYAGRRQWQ